MPKHCLFKAVPGSGQEASASKKTHKVEFYVDDSLHVVDKKRQAYLSQLALAINKVFDLAKGKQVDIELKIFSGSSVSGGSRSPDKLEGEVTIEFLRGQLEFKNPSCPLYTTLSHAKSNAEARMRNNSDYQETVIIFTAGKNEDQMGELAQPLKPEKSQAYNGMIIVADSENVQPLTEKYEGVFEVTKFSSSMKLLNEFLREALGGACAKETKQSASGTKAAAKKSAAQQQAAPLSLAGSSVTLRPRRSSTESSPSGSPTTKNPDQPPAGRVRFSKS